LFLAPSDVPLQDLTFTANLGIVLSHLPNRKVAIVSNLTSEPRHDETEFGLKYFQVMGYETFVSDTKFEGEADLKYLYDNIYVGGYGIFVLRFVTCLSMNFVDYQRNKRLSAQICQTQYINSE
jgi:N-dimethylarginine dimethylaminohydrolase